MEYLAKKKAHGALIHLRRIFPVAGKAETCYNFSGLCVSQPTGGHSI